MSGLVQALLQAAQAAAQWAWANPHQANVLLNTVRISHDNAQRYYRSLPPEKQQKIDAYIRWATDKAIKLGVTAVMGDLSDMVLGVSGSPEVVDFAKKVVERGVEVGLDKAIEECRRTPEGEAILGTPPVGGSTLTPEERDAALRQTEEEVARRRMEIEAERERRAQEEAQRREQAEADRIRQEQEAQALRVRLEQEERERQARIALLHEQDRPWRILRNSVRVVGVAALAVATLAVPSNMTGLSAFCRAAPVFFALGALTLGVGSTCYEGWER